MHDPKDIDSLFLRNLGKSLPDYTVSHPRKLIFVAATLKKISIFKVSSSLGLQCGTSGSGTPVLAYKSQTECAVSLQTHDRDESLVVFPYVLKVTTVFNATSKKKARLSNFCHKKSLALKISSNLVPS